MMQRPESAAQWFQLGMSQLRSQQWVAALHSFTETCNLAPGHKAAWNNRGNLLLDQGQAPEALACFERACALAPLEPSGHNNKGNALRDLSRLEEALAAYSRALHLDPKHLEALNNRGNVYSQLMRIDLAMQDFGAALAVAPEFSVTHRNIAHALTHQRAFALAKKHFERSLQMNPDDPLTHCFYGHLQRECGDLPGAQHSYEAAYRLNPHLEYIESLCAQAQVQRCDWRCLSERIDRIAANIQSGKRACLPFVAMGLLDEPALQLKAAQALVRAATPAAPQLGTVPKRRAAAKIRLGYFSADFHNHATAWLMAQLFELHDREVFELFAFSFGPPSEDEMRQRVSRAFDHFIDVNALSDLQVAQLSRERGIDIAIDLKGHSKDSRLGMLAQRCAPVQVNYLVYPGSIGGPYMDYIIADEIVIPRTDDAHYLEAVVRLPHSYQCNDATKVVAPQQFSRRELGLPEDAFVYCCFNNSYKILPATFALWMRILRQVPQSVLWLLEDNPDVRVNLRQHASAAGIDPLRLVFAPRLKLPLHLARHRAADLFLDTLPCNAHTTASDALWAGLPVLTLIGKAFAGRVAASLLTAIGLPELITNSAQEYEALAVNLANNPSAHANLKAKLARQRDVYPLFDTPLLCKNLELIYLEMQSRHEQGLAPAPIDLWPPAQRGTG